MDSAEYSKREPGSRGGKAGRALLRLALIAAGTYLTMVIMLALMQRSLTYFPFRQSRITPADSGLPAGQVHDIQMRSHDGLALHGWHVLPAGRTAQSAEQADRELQAGGPVALYFSGNGGNRAYRGEELQLLAEAGCHVLLFDYRGYGENPGKPSEANLVADALTAWQYATETRGVAPARILLYGESLGCAVAVRLAAELHATQSAPAGLILRSAFSSLADVGAYHYPWLPVRLLMIDRYDSARHIRSVRSPILQIHGARDTIIPLRFGQRLFAAAPERSAEGIPKRFVELPYADHNDVIFAHPREYREAVREFLEELQLATDGKAALNNKPPKSTY